MADNPPAPNAGPNPPMPSTGLTGRLKAPPAHLPVKKGGAGKIVVMLSSVAKPPPVNTQALPRVAPAPDQSLIVTPPPVSPGAGGPPPLPPKQVSPDNRAPQAPPRLSTTTHVKLPPKTNAPMWSSLSGKPLVPPAVVVKPGSKPLPPPLPVKASEPVQPVRQEAKKSSAQHIPPIKLNEPAIQSGFSGESILLQPERSAPAAASTPKPDEPKTVGPAESKSPEGGLQSLQAFELSQRTPAQPTTDTPSPEAKEQPAPLVAPPLLPPQRVVTPPPIAGAVPPLLPPPLPSLPPVALPPEVPAPPPLPTLHVAPPLLEKAPELPQEKLPPPHLPVDERKPETPPDLPESASVQKVPALIQPDAPPKPLLPPTLPAVKAAGSLLKKSAQLKKSTPLIVSSTSPKAPVPKIVEAKPALRPAVLPTRSLPIPQELEGLVTPPPVEVPKAPETAKTPEKSEPTISVGSPTPAGQSFATPPAVPMPAASIPASAEKEKIAATVLPSQPIPGVPATPKKNTPVPLTRAERAKKRRFVEMVFFWAVLVPITLTALYFASLHFGRDTRVEGQIIPPPGMTLSNEVWIVDDFHELAGGIAEDLAAERTPLMQEIQERQDHVQRAQADVAAREERIRLLQSQIDASKTEIYNVVKQSRDATQQLWDVDGAQIDADYNSRLHELQRAIADRAKSLNLKYEPDDSYQSPEVWANAYRLALYEVPPGVDTVKEHQWLSDVMKQWRDFQKSLDDRKEQLREKADQIKQAPAPKLADLNAKIDDLQQRIDATEAEEIPLKAELQQAQTDLGDAQASEAGLDDKYYKQLYVLPEEAIVNHIRIPLATNGRFTWVDDDVFGEGVKQHSYWMFSCATRADGRQYWALQRFSISKNQTLELYLEPTGFISTKAILRPDLSPEEQEQ